MAWSTPRTWVTGETVTAAIMNAHVRDQFRETSPFTVTTAGDLSYADAANSMNSRLAIGSTGTILASTGSAPAWRESATMTGSATYTSPPSASPTTFKDLNDADWNTGTSVTVTVTTGTVALVHFGARYVSSSTAGANLQLSYRVSGATTIASAIDKATAAESSQASDLLPSARSHLVTTLTAGSNVFTFQAQSSSGSSTSTIAYPYIIVEGR